VERIADGVWAAIATPSGHGVSNAGIIDLGDRTLLFDAFLDPRASRDLAQVALNVTGHRATLAVVSHGHNDHFRGVHGLDPATTLITTAEAAKAIEQDRAEVEAEKRELPEEIAKARGAIAGARAGTWDEKEATIWCAYFEAIGDSHAGLTWRQPDQWLDAPKREIKGTRRTVILRVLAGHTASDVVAIVPDGGVVFTGDLLFVQHHPYLADGDPDRLLASLAELLGINATTYVPGHGPLGTADDVARMRGYVDDLRKLAATSTADVSGTPVPVSYAPWHYRRFFGSNLKWLRARKTPSATP
jgi:glyoxylase-like metal-dependent hydrolase (beta-lactamase superfamily II)